jgi:hypothetical protein
MADAPPPLAFYWNGQAMVPLHPRLAAKHFGAGEVVKLEVREDRSAKSHRYYFAALNEAHANLPEDKAERWPTMQHLRKYALIHCGYRDERSIVCASKAEALRLAGFIKPMDGFAVVTVREAVVTVYTAKSQSVRAMGKKEFEESKRRVLDFVARLIGTDSATLQRHTSEAA